MLKTPQRFAKRRFWRLADEILRQADWFNPGDTTVEWEMTHSTAQLRRHYERSSDFEAIGEAALALRDAIGSLR